MSKLDEAMRKHIEYLVLKEGLPLSFHDFEVDGVQYHLSRGTFRNNISSLLKKGKAEMASVAFYVLIDFESTKHFPLVRIMNDNSDDNYTLL